VLLGCLVACVIVLYHHYRKVRRDVVQLSQVPDAQKESLKHLTTPGLHGNNTPGLVTVEITPEASRFRDRAPAPISADVQSKSASTKGRRS
jgi:hypothetical protein